MRRLVFLIAPLALVLLTAGQRRGGDLPLSANRGGNGTQLQQCNGGDPQRAVSACTAIINSSAAPTMRSSAYTNRGFAHLRQNDLDSALQDYNSALELDPKMSKPSSIAAMSIRSRTITSAPSPITSRLS